MERVIDCPHCKDVDSCFEEMTYPVGTGIGINGMHDLIGNVSELHFKIDTSVNDSWYYSTNRPAIFGGSYQYVNDLGQSIMWPDLTSYTGFRCARTLSNQ